MSKDEFVAQLQDETVSYDARLGLIGGSMPQVWTILFYYFTNLLL